MPRQYESKPLPLEDTRSQKAKRTCLKCNRLFDSRSPANRICYKCSMSNETLPQCLRHHPVIDVGNGKGHSE